MESCCTATNRTGRAAVMVAARHLFSTRGFHRTAIAELANAADVSVGQIYRLFASKADIVLAIVHEDSHARLTAVATLVEQVRAGALPIECAFTELALQALSKGDEALSFEIMAEAHRNPAVSDSLASLCARYRAVIRELACVANPDLSTSRLDGAEEVVLSILFGLGHRTLSRPALPPQETARRTAQMILIALTAD